MILYLPGKRKTNKIQIEDLLVLSDTIPRYIRFMYFQQRTKPRVPIQRLNALGIDLNTFSNESYQVIIHIS